jgi:hypothetical protein
MNHNPPNRSLRPSIEGQQMLSQRSDLSSCKLTSANLQSPLKKQHVNNSSQCIPAGQHNLDHLEVTVPIAAGATSSRFRRDEHCHRGMSCTNTAAQMDQRAKRYQRGRRDSL